MVIAATANVTHGDAVDPFAMQVAEQFAGNNPADAVRIEECDVNHTFWRCTGNSVRRRVFSPCDIGC
jgi:hypothetical protein